MSAARTPLPQAAALAWRLRGDLRHGAAADAPLSEWFRFWWVTDGRREYPEWGSGDDLEALDLLRPLADWPRFGGFGMTPLLRHLMSSREDLQASFDVSTEGGLWHAIAWLFTHGLREYSLLDAVDAATRAALDDTPPFFRVGEPAGERPASEQPLPNWLMFFVWRCDGNLQAAFDLRTPAGQLAYLHWFLFEGVANLRLAPLVATRWRHWLRQPVALASLPQVPVDRAGLLLWQRSADLQQSFDLRTAAGWQGLSQWTQAAWQTEPGMRWVLAAPDGVPTGAPAVPSAARPRPFGVNLIGFAFGELGIGEDVRMAVAACETAGIPFSVVNIHPGDHLRQADLSLGEHVANGSREAAVAPYSINVFCLTGFDTARVYLERGVSLFRDRYNIGWWPWELPVWPEHWRVAFDLVDEVWAATEFTRALYSAAQDRGERSATTVLMPLPASVSRVTAMTRRSLGLAESRTLFLYVFDFNSYLSRKNPLAAVEAFRRAFPPTDDSVGLVLKTMNSNPGNPQWKCFLRECSRDRRIQVLDRTLERGEVLGLIQACDVYVSLHRSEGFGRTLAEAMLFGKPVVATDFSGNVDFLTRDSGFPVAWKPCSVEPGDYPFVTEADGAWWAEPDVDDAASRMREARLAARDAGFAARTLRFAAAQFSPARIGQLMKARLIAIEAGLQRPGPVPGA